MIKKIKKIRNHIRTIHRYIIREPLNSGHRIQLIKRYLDWETRYKYKNRTYKIIFENGMSSLVFPYPDHDAGEANIYSHNVDYYDNQFVRSQLSQGDFIIDAGCNVGNRTWVLADLIGGAILIDANEKCIARARQNHALNKLENNTFLFVQKALGNHTGKIRFTDKGGASTINHIIPNEKNTDVSFVEVPLTTIDEIVLSSRITPSYIKIDVEGQELAVLEGALSTLTSGKFRLIKFEHNQGDPLEPILELLDDINFVTFTLDHNGHPTKRKQDIERNLNLFAAPFSKVDRMLTWTPPASYSMLQESDIYTNS